jgi:hypothetical protein
LANTAAMAPAIPFKIAGRKQTRSAFTPATVTLGSSAVSFSPLEVPATGYLAALRLEVTGTWSGGGAGTSFNADAPFNSISSIGVRDASGTPLITPMTGYQLYLINKYGGQVYAGVSADPKSAYGYAATAGTATGTFKFFLSLPFEFDHETGLGAIPALASNRSYIVDITAAPIATIFGATNTPTGATLNIIGYSEYWTQPAAANSQGQAQQPQPQGLGTLGRWLFEGISVTAGTKSLKSNNVGGTIRNHILVLRTAAGVRTDSDWPALFQLYVDNEPQNYLTSTYFADAMARQFNFTSLTKDAAGGLDTGVYVLPYHAWLGAVGGDTNNSRGQLLNTNSATLLQFYGGAFGANAATLEVITQSVSGRATDIYSR